MIKAMYGFSGDPITYGHIDIIQRAARVFDEVIVGMGVNPDKKYMFNLDERTEMARKALSHLANVKLTPFEGLLVDYAWEHGVSVVVKGVRNSADFDYENILHQVGESQKHGIDTHILFSRPELSHVSSSAVKAIQKEQGLIHGYVPLHVKQSLEAKMSGQYIIGVTGEIGCGKSYTSEKLVEAGKARGIDVHNIELDDVGHQIISTLSEPRYEEIRQTIINSFAPGVKAADGSINRKALGEIVFNDKNELQKLNEIMYKPLIVRLRREMYGKKGLILINAALIAEADLMHLCNNNVVLIDVDKPTQQKRLVKRGLTDKQIKRRLESQYDFKQKRDTVRAAIDKHNQGRLWTFKNSDNEQDDIDKLLMHIIDELKIK